MTLTASSQFKNAISQQLAQLQKTAASQITAQFFDSVMTICPVEDGHAHEACLTAMQELSGELFGREFNNTVRSHIRKRSGDSEASAGVTTKIGETGGDFVCNVVIDLPFMRKLEYGGLIRVGDRAGNRGPKINPVQRPPNRGPLYGARGARKRATKRALQKRKGRSAAVSFVSGRLSQTEAALIRTGLGILVWEENGTVYRQLTRRVKAYAFWRNGLMSARAVARQMKLKAT